MKLSCLKWHSWYFSFNTGIFPRVSEEGIQETHNQRCEQDQEYLLAHVDEGAHYGVSHLRGEASQNELEKNSTDPCAGLG